MNGDTEAAWTKIYKFLLWISCTLQIRAWFKMNPQEKRLCGIVRHARSAKDTWCHKDRVCNMPRQELNLRDELWPKFSVLSVFELWKWSTFPAFQVHHMREHITFQNWGTKQGPGATGNQGMGRTGRIMPAIASNVDTRVCAWAPPSGEAVAPPWEARTPISAARSSPTGGAPTASCCPPRAVIASQSYSWSNEG